MQMLVRYGSCPRFLLGLLLLGSTFITLLPGGTASAGEAVKIRQRIGLRHDTSQGTPVTDGVSVGVAGGFAISGDTLYVPTGLALQFSAASIPGGCEASIQWQAPGGSPQFGLGPSFQTSFSTPGPRTIRATCGAAADTVRVLAYRVTATEVAFDWEPGDLRDGVDIRKNRTTDVLKPEWSSTRNEAIAYVRGIQPRVRVRFSVEPASITRLNIGAQAPAPWLGFQERQINFAGGVSVPDTAYFTLLGATPTTVSRDTVAINWRGSDPNGLESDPVVFAASGPHPFYTLHATPRAPMVEPWTEVLWYACDYARGSVTEEDIVRNLVLGVYWNSNLIYNPVYYYSTGYSTMNLTQFLYDMAHSPFVYLDCRDCSHWTHLQSNALGMNGQYITLGFSFTTNYVKDMGRDYWHQWSFNFHQVGYFWSLKVADMAAAGDGDGVPWSPPHTESLSTGQITLTDYLDMFTEATWVHPAGVGICNPF